MFRRSTALSAGRYPIPNLDLNYAATGALSGIETFTRASSAWAFNQTGTLSQYAANTPRFDYDPARQVLFVTMEFEPVDGSAPWRVLLAHRQFFPQELEALLAYNGFLVDEVHGGFEGEPLDRGSDVALFSCRVA